MAINYRHLICAERCRFAASTFSCECASPGESIYLAVIECQIYRLEEKTAAFSFQLPPLFLYSVFYILFFIFYFFNSQYTPYPGMLIS